MIKEIKTVLAKNGVPKNVCNLDLILSIALKKANQQGKDEVIIILKFA